jgi:hypothetical protein
MGLIKSSAICITTSRFLQKRPKKSLFTAIKSKTTHFRGSRGEHLASGLQQHFGVLLPKQFTESVNLHRALEPHSFDFDKHNNQRISFYLDKTCENNKNKLKVKKVDYKRQNVKKVSYKVELY